MSEEEKDREEERDPNEEAKDHSEQDNIVPVSGMYKDWFLDYASYVILERAVPALMDGLKPVQRRILHSMKDLDDGRYNKVANIIGHTMQYHPHGDASIGDAMVQIGQKDLLIDMQGNWGNTLTGDGAAAPRYIEARLSKFAGEVVFNPKTTEWQASYDGRKQEPIHLPVKFPLLLAQGAEGIAVGLACKILPHNFIELIEGSINILKGKKVEIFPDFATGGLADFTQYNDGIRGGKIKVRAKIRQEDKKTLVIDEIPFGTTTTSLIESIIKANDRGKIKVKKIEDNTSDKAEILIHIPTGVSPDKLTDALYAFTDCEVSISPNIAVIEDDKPVFLGVSELLRRSTDHTVHLLKRELEIKLGELEEKWHFSSLEKIFIENRIYRDIEEEETWEGVISAIDNGLKPHVKHLKREVTEEDIVRLTEIRIKRISKFDSFKADEEIKNLEDAIEKVKHDLDNLVEFAISYFKRLKEKYGEGRERKTEIRVFDNIQASKVVIANKKLYVDYKEGFIGTSSRIGEQVSECSDIDDIIVFRSDGVMQVVRIDDKKYVGKGILHAGVWKKGDERTIYHLIYKDGKTGQSFIKRFAIKSITREKEYDLTQGNSGSKVHYFSVNPNGRKETVTVHLKPRSGLKKLKIDLEIHEQLIKGRGAKGNRLTKEQILKVVQKETGGSTLDARKIWFDDVVKRLNDDERGNLLGAFSGDDRILTIYENGEYRLSGFDLTTRFDDGLIHIEKFNENHPVSCIYFDGEKDKHYVKRFVPESSADRMVPFISEHEKSKLELVSTLKDALVDVTYRRKDKDTGKSIKETINLSEFIDVKGEKAQGNQLDKDSVRKIELLEEQSVAWEVEEGEEETPSESTPQEEKKVVKIEAPEGKSVTVELDIEPKKKEEDDDDEKDQMSLF